MMISSNSSQWGSRVAYSFGPVTALQDHCRNQASPHGHYRFLAALFPDGPFIARWREEPEAMPTVRAAPLGSIAHALASDRD